MYPFHFSSDGGSNLKKAMRTLKESEGGGPFCTLRCFCHLTNNCVKPALSENSDAATSTNRASIMMKQLKKITAHFKHSGQNNELTSSLKQSMVRRFLIVFLSLSLSFSLSLFFSFFNFLFSLSFYILLLFLLFLFINS
jgi:hypothetical protein